MKRHVYVLILSVITLLGAGTLVWTQEVTPPVQQEPPQLFVATSGSWSLVVTVPDGTACLVGAGEDALILPPARPDGAPS